MRLSPPKKKPTMPVSIPLELKRAWTKRIHDAKYALRVLKDSDQLYGCGDIELRYKAAKLRKLGTDLLNATNREFTGQLKAHHGSRFHITQTNDLEWVVRAWPPYHEECARDYRFTKTLRATEKPRVFSSIMQIAREKGLIK